MKRDSETDTLIINSYKTTIDALASYLGEAFEIVLHDLGDLDHSIIKIVNGFHSGRKEGAPITDLALLMLEKINKGKSERNDSERFSTYYSKSKYGKPVKSTTMAIFGENDTAIGLLCINMYLDSPLTSLLQSFSLDDSRAYIAESFINDSDELIIRVLEKVKHEVTQDTTILASQKNKEIITLLYHQGIFKLKNAVKIISENLGISRNTVYMHVRTLENTERLA
ncbi:MAG: PAS domain-containing protein [Treponema sp.]|jgi:predicted transcriptional regulator YheO|nr:PAS domain-containing protein [Treponema sp.]